MFGLRLGDRCGCMYLCSSPYDLSTNIQLLVHNGERQHGSNDQQIALLIDWAAYSSRWGLERMQ